MSLAFITVPQFHVQSMDWSLGMGKYVDIIEFPI